MPDFGLFQVGVPDFVWFQNVVLPVLGMGLGGFAMFGVYRTINRFLDRRHERLMALKGTSSGPEVEDLRNRVEALEEAAFRVQELEERLDFTERMLTKNQRPPMDTGRDN
jgi:preprotein translocase subunit SecF